MPPSEGQTAAGRRLTGPLRALARMAGRRRGPKAEHSPPPPPPVIYDSWLEHFYGPELRAIDAACGEGGGPERFELFRHLDVDLWALLLTQEYQLYPNIRRLLPDVPDTTLQEVWNGASGARLAAQSAAFYTKLRERFAEHSDVPIEHASVLDFGCGWGRLTRFLARDVAPQRLFACDPVTAILDLCRDCRVPARLGRTDFVPQRLPFDERFDLVFAFSVFTHISERAHEHSLRAIHEGLRPGGLLVVTVRPPEYLWAHELLEPARASLGPNPRGRFGEPLYLFVPHPARPTHLQYDGGEMTYGETVISLPYVRQRWAPMFDLLEVGLLVGDLHQVMLTLRRR